MKVRALSSVAVAAARRVLAENDVRHAREIHVEALAARHGAFVLYGPVSTSRARIVKTSAHAIVRIDARARGTTHARFAVAHELGHFLLHASVDHFEQCVGEVAAPRRGSAWRTEREANDFAAELLIPEALAAPLCNPSRPRLDDVERLARHFKTSPEMSAIRFVQLASSPCAAALVVDGKVRWAAENASFPGKIVRGRQVDDQRGVERDSAERLPLRSGELWWFSTR